MFFELVLRARMGERSPRQIGRALSDGEIIRSMNDVFNVDESSEWVSPASNRHDAPIRSLRST